MKTGIKDISWLENSNKVHPALVMLVSHKKNSLITRLEVFSYPHGLQLFVGPVTVVKEFIFLYYVWKFLPCQNTAKVFTSIYKKLFPSLSLYLSQCK